MPITYNDTFTRANTIAGAGLGVTEGAPAKSWEVLAGTGWRILNNRPYTADLRGNNPIAVINGGSQNVDAVLDVATGGDALYFRVVDANNWWRIKTEEYTGSSNYQYNYTYIGPWSGWAQTGGFGPYAAAYCSQETLGVCSQETRKTLSNGGSTTSFLVERRDRLVETRTATGTNYFPVPSVLLQKCVAGSITTVATYGASSAKVRAVTDANSIGWYRWTGSAWAVVSTITDATHNTGKKHGLGRGSSTNDIQALDNFTLISANSPTRIYNGTTFVDHTIRIWNGSSWGDYQARIWNGSAWVDH